MKRSRSSSEKAIAFARSQRRTSNEFATIVWQWIRNRQIDGESHFTENGVAYDPHRDRFLRSQGFRVLRIPGYAVIREEGTR